MDADRETLRANLAEVENRMVRACARAGRKRSDATMVAVTKTVAPEIAALLPELGVLDLGENRPQELWRKSALLPKDVRWHLIGHLQRNKVEKTLPIVHLIHSVDNARLLRSLEQEDRHTDVLLEVNVSGEMAKQGFAPAEVIQLMPILRELKNVHVRGLMTMAPLQDAEACRPTFSGLRNLRDRLREQGLTSIEHLSMGMSNDFEVAIEEGATFVRLGSVLFEGAS
jgi:pyridoxal phosphate enzyme (YggS family)